MARHSAGAHPGSALTLKGSSDPSGTVGAIHALYDDCVQLACAKCVQIAPTAVGSCAWGPRPACLELEDNTANTDEEGGENGEDLG